MGKLKAVKMQDGVTLWMNKSGVYVDIDVEPDVETVVLNCPDDEDGDFCFENQSGKVFPNVKFLHIGANVYYIKLDNRMFPNVIYVKSDNEAFWSGPLLINDSENHGTMLLNTFAKSESDVIDLSGVSYIEKKAFDGCKSEHIINSGSVVCCVDDFSGTELLKKTPFDENGLRVIAGMLIDVDTKREEVIIPDDNSVHVIRHGISWPDVKKLIIHSRSFFEEIKDKSWNMPKNIEIDFPISTYDIFDLGHFEGNEYINILNSDVCKSIDGLIYSSDGKELLSCPSSRTGTINIPEGVKKIMAGAFQFRPIEKVSFPSTLASIGSYAFDGCDYLKEVELGTGIEEIGCSKENNIFGKCYNLKKIVIPPQVRMIGCEAFFQSGLTSVTLPEGLKCICPAAFYGCKIESIFIPESVTYVGMDALSDTKKIIAKKYISDIITSFIRCDFFYMDMEWRTVEVVVNGRSARIPKIVDCEKSVGTIDNVLKEYFTVESVSNELLDEVYDFYAFGANLSVREDLSVEMALYDRKNYMALEYAYRHSNRIAERLIEDNNQEKIMQFIKLKAMREEAFNKLLQYSIQNELIEISAYLLDNINAEHESKADDVVCRSNVFARRLESQFEV